MRWDLILSKLSCSAFIGQTNVSSMFSCIKASDLASDHTNGSLTGEVKQISMSTCTLMVTVQAN